MRKMNKPTSVFKEKETTLSSITTNPCATENGMEKLLYQGSSTLYRPRTVTEVSVVIVKLKLLVFGNENQCYITDMLLKFY